MTTNSSNKEVFDKDKVKYVKALEDSKHKVYIEYMEKN